MLRALIASTLTFACTLCVSAQQAYMLLAKPDTVAWGYHSGPAKPALTVKSGDTVKMQTMSTCGSRDRLLKGGVKAEDIPPNTDAIYNEVNDKVPVATSLPVP